MCVECQSKPFTSHLCYNNYTQVDQSLAISGYHCKICVYNVSTVQTSFEVVYHGHHTNKPHSKQHWINIADMHFHITVYSIILYII